jgi:hypothetical protein
VAARRQSGNSHRREARQSQGLASVYSMLVDDTNK